MLQATSQSVRILGAGDASEFQTVNLEALRLHPGAFSASCEDEEVLETSAFAERLDRGTVFGGFVDDNLEAIATHQRQALRKRLHVAMLSGMYVREKYRGSGLARAILDRVIDHASREADQLEPYVAVDNEQARKVLPRLWVRTLSSDATVLTGRWSGS